MTNNSNGLIEREFQKHRSIYRNTFIEIPRHLTTFGVGYHSINSAAQAGFDPIICGVGVAFTGMAYALGAIISAKEDNNNIKNQIKLLK